MVRAKTQVCQGSVVPEDCTKNLEAVFQIAIVPAILVPSHPHYRIHNTFHPVSKPAY